VTTARGELTRAAILRAAAPLFAEQGYRGASLAKVAEAVGLTQPGLLHHFPSKEHLLLALLEERYHADGKVLSGRSSESGLLLLDALVDIVAHNETVPDGVKLFTVLVAESIAADHPAHDHFVERYRKVRHRMARDLRAGQATGEIRDDIDVKLLVPIIVGVMDGLQNQWLLDDEIDMLASFRLFCDLMVNSLKGQHVSEAGLLSQRGEPSDSAAS
jgi:AcrR family transcriptional regulator